MSDNDGTDSSDRKPEIHQTRTLGELLDPTLERIIQESRAHARAWEEWWEQVRNKPEVLAAAVCPFHPDQAMVVDRDKSIQASFWARPEKRIEWSPCPNCLAGIALAKEAAWLEKMGVPRNMTHCTLDNWTVRTMVDQETLTVCRHYAEHPDGALLLFGKDHGVGKTHLAVAIMREVHRGKFVPYIDFTAALLNQPLGDQGIHDAVAPLLIPSLLVLDDLTISYEGRNNKEATHKLLDKRVGMGLPFVLTGNLQTALEIETLLGTAAVDRLEGFTYESRILSGESFRKFRKSLRSRSSP